MTNSEILTRVDHTLLRPDAAWTEYQALCREAVAHRTASVCVPPSGVARIAAEFPGLNICTVVGFPLGYSVIEAKLCEAERALADGASEIDMVINIGDAKNGRFEQITSEISALKKAVGAKILKVIVETCYLTTEEKTAVCECVTEGGADYIKTSTGFGSGGATIEDVLLFKRNIGPGVKIKAAGGIRTREDMVAFLEAGCDRLGTSSAVRILADPGA